MKSLTCFLPCRKGSERVQRKNIRTFAGVEHGLIAIKLGQLRKAKKIDQIVLSTDDDEVLEYAASLAEPRLKLHKRKSELASSATSTDELVDHVLELIPDGHILWTHVTSPFITAEHYDQMVERYQAALKEGFDSLMTTTEIQNFIWKDGIPINYDRSIEKWPRTQTLLPVHEVNSGAFIAAADIYRRYNDRIGRSPFLYPLSKLVGFDIDWPEDFAIAECIAANNLTAL